MTLEKCTANYLIRLKPSTLSRWRTSAEDANLTLSAYIRKRVDGHPVLPPSVPAVNASLGVRLGDIKLQLGRIGNNINQIATVLNSARKTGQPLPQLLPSPESLTQLLELIIQEQDHLRELTFQLNGIDKLPPEDDEDMITLSDALRAQFDLEEVE